jgi:hypothetical protein
MKIRKGFVSNSSSSSFVCCICNFTEEVEDSEVVDNCSFIRCSEGHTFCKQHLNKKIPTKEVVSLLLTEDNIIARELGKKFAAANSKNISFRNIYNFDGALDVTYDDEGDNNDRYHQQYSFVTNLPIYMCPVCRFDMADNQELLKYFLKQSNLTIEQVLKQLKQQFQTHQQFKQHLDKKTKGTTK